MRLPALLLVLAAVLVSLAAPAWAGAAALRADFDGDGYQDLAVGAPQDSVGGADNAGAVNVIYGGSGGLTSRGDQQFTQNTPGVLGVANPADRFGAALASGDFDGDGAADLAIGAPGDTVPGAARAGVVNVLYGSSGGLRTRGDDLWHHDTPGIKGRARREADFGAALAAGDVDGDGRDDLAVGVPEQTVDGVRAAGAVNVLYGTAAGLTEGRDDYWHQNASGVKAVAGEFDRFGFAVAVRDVSRNGRAELLVGVPGETIGGRTGAGAFHVLYGRSGGLTANPDDFYHQDAAGIKGIAGNGDGLGSAIAAADFDGDGTDDVAAGAPRDTSGGVPLAGAVNVLYGATTGLTSRDQVFSQATRGIRGTPDRNDRFGAALAAADVSRNGRAELLIGVPWEDVRGRRDAGAVNVLYGGSNGLRRSADQLWHQGSPGVSSTLQALDHFGEAVAVADFDGDGDHDLAAAAPNDRVQGREGAGAVTILQGSTTGLGSAGDRLFTQGTAGILGTPGRDAFGAALTGAGPAD